MIVMDRATWSHLTQTLLQNLFQYMKLPSLVEQQSTQSGVQLPMLILHLEPYCWWECQHLWQLIQLLFSLGINQEPNPYLTQNALKSSLNSTLPPKVTLALPTIR